MKRGSPLERDLAYAGTGLWALWVALGLVPPVDPFAVSIGILAIVLSIREFRRWQRWERVTGGRKDGQETYPRWAWFAVGAVPAVFVTAIADAVMFGPAAASEDHAWVGIVAWIVGGISAEYLLVRRAKQREAMEHTSAPPLPPPPPPADVSPSVP